MPLISRPDGFVLVKHLQVVPIVTSAILTVTCIIPFVMSTASGRSFTPRVPTISEAAREFPGSRVFSVGSTIGGSLIAFCGLMLFEIPGIHGHPLPSRVKVLPILVAVFLVLMSGFGLDDNLFVHLTSAMIGFFAIFCLCGLFLAVFDKLGILALREFRGVVLGVGGIALAVLTMTWAQGTHDPIGSVKSVSEFILVLSFIVFMLTWAVEFSEYTLVMRLCTAC